MPRSTPNRLDRRSLLASLATLPAWPGLIGTAAAQAQTAPLASWNDRPARQAILEFVRVTTDQASPSFVPPEERIATFDQDGTLWVEQPAYSQLIYCFDRVPALVKAKPELANVEPFKTVLSGDHEAIADLPMDDLEKIAVATLTGMSVGELKTGEGVARDRSASSLAAPLHRAQLPADAGGAQFLRANGYKTYIVTGGGQAFVRVFAEQVYGIPPEQVVGSMGGVSFSYASDGKPVLTKDPKLLLNDDHAGKPECIYLMIGRRPRAAFGNSIGDQQMLEYTKAGDGARLSMLVLHDDAQREYAYGPANGLPDSRSEPSPRRSTTRRRARAGRSSA